LPPTRHRPSDPGFRNRTGHGCRGPQDPRRTPAAPDREHPAGRPGDRTRGVPDRVHHVRGECLSDVAGLGRHLRPGADRGDGGRVEGTMGEAPYLVGAVGTAYVRGLQSAGVVATLKHFAGYSASRGARNHAPVSIGPRELADVILPPFEMALREGGAGSVMNSYTDVDGVPVGSDETLLTGVLRDEWGFDGVVVSDYWSVSFLE